MEMYAINDVFTLQQTNGEIFKHSLKMCREFARGLTLVFIEASLRDDM